MNEPARIETSKDNMTVAAAPAPVTLQDTLERMKSQFALVLPKHITPERMVRIALTACQNNPKLLQADRKSFLGAVMRAAQLGLEPDGVLGQAYLIPFNRSIKTDEGWKSKLEVQFIPGYKGLIDLARRSGEVSNIIAKEVCKNDTFKIAWHQQPPFFHEQSTNSERGEIIGFWAMANFKDGGYHWDYMTLAEIHAIRNASAGWQSASKANKTADSPWEKHFVEMGKKTAIRRIAKYLPMSVQKAVAVDELSERGAQFHENEFGDIVIDDSDTLIDQEPVSETKGNAGVKEKLKRGRKPKDEPPSTEEKQPENDEAVSLPPLGTIDEIKSSALTLISALNALPAEQRPGMFMRLHGSEIAEALKDHGQGLLIAKLRETGIKLPF